MDLIKTVSDILGWISIVIGILLIPLSIWFFKPAFKDSDSTSWIIAILIVILAIACFYAAFSMFTTGLIKQAAIFY
jgi:drug/metabolite transporter (DMT)-like permease